MPKAIVLPGGEKYIGELSGEIPHGKGKMELSDGSIYEGNFANGEFDGFGIFVSPRGRYEGEWMNGVPHGEGTFAFSNGTIRKGKWEKGNFLSEEQAKENYNPDSKHITIKYQNGIYTGEVKHGLPHGKGKMVLPDGVHFAGIWEKGELSGPYNLNQKDYSGQQAQPAEPSNNKVKQKIVSFKVMPGRDDDLIAWLNTLGKGEKSFFIRQALRKHISDA